MLVSDNRAIVNYLNGNLMYAHKIVFKPNNFLALGMGLGFANNSLNNEKVNTQVKNYPSFQVLNSTRLDVGFGAAYYLNNWKFGFSAPHIFDQFGDFSNHYNTSVAYNVITKNNDWKFVPSAIVRNYKNVGLLYDIMGLSVWKETVTGQFSYEPTKVLLLVLALIGKY